MGVWIEIFQNATLQDGEEVAPLVGVWIEIDKPCDFIVEYIVAPLVGVWIEILTTSVNVFP